MDKCNFRLFKRIVITITILIILGAACIAYSYLIEPDRLHKTSVDVYTEKLNGDILKVALFSDIHFGDNYTVSDFEHVIDMINSESPDIIVFAGDFFDDLETFTGDVKDLSEAMGKLSAPLGKYAVFGNHDYSGKSEFSYEKIMSAGGFLVLKNEIINLNDVNLSIVAVDDCLIGYGDVEIVSYTDDTRFNLLLCHEPDVVDDIIENNYNFDLMLSGHTHGGQLRIPVLSHKFLPPLGKRYVSGMYDFDGGRQLYVTKGIGTSFLPLRFNAVPEVCFMTLQ